MTVKVLYPGLVQPVLPPSLQPEAVMESKWHQPWSEPVRLKRGLGAHLQRAYVADPTPFPVSKNIGWYRPLEPPVRLKRGLGAQYQQWDSLQVPVQPIPSSLIQWFAPLSEPVRIKLGLRPANQDFLFYEEEFPEDMDVDWYNWFSEPVREKIGLRVSLQESLFHPPRILPTPDVIATMAATETNEDVALFGVYVYNPATPSTAGPAIRASVIEIPQDRGSVASIEES